jgi:hypothetical protein
VLKHAQGQVGMQGPYAHSKLEKLNAHGSPYPPAQFLFAPSKLIV